MRWNAFPLFVLMGYMLASGGCTRKAVRWINTHPKPITAHVQQFEFRRLPDLTLIDAEGQVKYAGKTKLTLPDTIK